MNSSFNGAEQLFCKIILWVLLILCEASKHVQKAHCFTPAFAYLFMQKPFLCTQYWPLGYLTSLFTWKVKVSVTRSVWLFVTPWTVAHQALLSMRFSRQEYWSGLPFPPPWDRTLISSISCIGRQILYHWVTKEALKSLSIYRKAAKIVQLFPYSPFPVSPQVSIL